MAEIARVTRAPVFHMPSISQAVVHGGTVYVSGVLGTLGTSVELVGGGIEAETRQAVANLVHVLDAAGSSLDNLLKGTDRGLPPDGGDLRRTDYVPTGAHDGVRHSTPPQRRDRARCHRRGLADAMSDADSYVRARGLFAEAVRAADPTRAVPACPGWSIHDLLAHQVHQLRGTVDGSFPFEDALTRLTASVTSERAAAAERQDAWIAQGITELRSKSIAELIEHWDHLVRHAGAGALQVLAPDLIVHLFDLLAALGRTDHRDDPCVTEALEFWAPFASVNPDDADEKFEVLRAITGRRARVQAQSLPDSAALYGWRASPLVE
jgi:hypothetical protein